MASAVKYIPNLLSVSRILFSILLLFFFKNKPAFLVVYLAAGITDVLDGFIARKYKVQTLAGARLDSLGDLCFFVILILYLIAEYGQLMLYYIYFIAGIFILRILNILVGFARYKSLVMIHTLANKAAGLLVFLLPIILITGRSLLLQVIIGVALVAALEELVIILWSPRGRIDLNTRTVFHLRSQ